MKAFGMFLLLTIGVGNARVGHAIDYGSQALWCVRQNTTFACPEAFTSISLSEVALFYQIDVNATFRGPGYNQYQGAHKEIVGWNPSMWKVTTKLTPQICAHRGTHSVEGTHNWHIVPGAGPVGGVDSSDSWYRWICDCGPPTY